MKKKLRAAAEALEEVVESAGQELERLCGETEVDRLDNLDLADVMLGLLARQYHLWMISILSPGASTAPVAPMILRALADATITMAWLRANARWAEQYKLYSAGRLKLLAEHWRARETPETKEFVSAYADQLAEMADTERWQAVLPVELGSWNGKDIRAMAIETGLKDIYDLAYSPMSAEAHGEWMCLRERFMRPCSEPLHPTHWLPVFERPHRITNFPRTASIYFLNGLNIGLGALGLEYRADFWSDVGAKLEAAFDEVLKAETEAANMEEQQR